MNSTAKPVNPNAEYLRVLACTIGGPDRIHNLFRIAKKIEELEEALPDPKKLELLSFWFDNEQSTRAKWTGTKVQEDLRRWAKKIKEVSQ